LRSEFSVERNGHTRILDSNRVVARNENNEPEFLIALLEDITERRQLSSDLENTKKFLEMIIDNVPIALDVKRVSDGQYLFVNRSAEKIFNREREAVIGCNLSAVTFPFPTYGVIVPRLFTICSFQRASTAEFWINEEGLRMLGRGTAVH